MKPPGSGGQLRCSLVITGAAGQLGRELTTVLTPHYHVVPLTRRELDITNRSQVEELVAAHKPEFILHAAAYTDVDQAEQDYEMAYQVNALGSRYIAEAAERVGAKLLYVSTDYVFDGSKGGPYTETDTPSPINRYGATKLLGESFVQQFCSKTYIVRTSWLYGSSPRSFVNTIRRLAQQRSELDVVHDCVGSPTYARDLAACISQLMLTDAYGVYHAANEGSCSRYELAQAIVQELQLSQVTVRPVPSSQFRQLAPRPLHTALDCQALRRQGLPLLRDWRSALHAFLHASPNR